MRVLGGAAGVVDVHHPGGVLESSLRTRLAAPISVGVGSRRRGP